VSGPNLVADDVEWSTVDASYPGLDHAGGAGATAATVRAMFGGHDLVHVAAHGRFRSDRPLLSTLELADGLVTLHDAIPAKVACKLAVLSSCEGGAHRGADGSEVLGLAALLLARGAASVLAPLTVVRDLECGEFVAAVHERFARGVPFGRAVADPRRRRRNSRPRPMRRRERKPWLTVRQEKKRRRTTSILSLRTKKVQKQAS
jgi:hypothetical protein